MKKLHTFDLWQRPLAGMFKELLRTEGVDCLVRNEQLIAAMGEIPFTECYPELWVIDNEVYPRARVLLDGWLMEPDEETAEPWTCQVCGETSEAQFNACWCCEGQRDNRPPPAAPAESMGRFSPSRILLHRVCNRHPKSAIFPLDLNQDGDFNDAR